MNPIFLALYITTAFVFALAHGSERFGWRRMLLLLALTFGISLLFESLGVATGAVYGGYHYTDHLGPMFLGLVPYIIPLAWFMMVYPSLVIAIRIVPVSHKRFIWVLLVSAIGALAMTAWDLALDPVLVHFGAWKWQTPGAYFGIPVQNFLGWWLTSFTIFALFLLLGRIPIPQADRWSGSFSRLPVIVYIITGLSTVLVAQDRGLSGPALAGFFAMLPWAIVGWWGRK